MKKRLLFFLVLICVLPSLFLSGCGNDAKDPTKNNAEESDISKIQDVSEPVETNTNYMSWSEFFLNAKHVVAYSLCDDKDDKIWKYCILDKGYCILLEDYGILSTIGDLSKENEENTSLNILLELISGLLDSFEERFPESDALDELYDLYDSCENLDENNMDELNKAIDASLDFIEKNDPSASKMIFTLYTDSTGNIVKEERFYNPLGSNDSIALCYGKEETAKYHRVFMSDSISGKTLTQYYQGDDELSFVFGNSNYTIIDPQQQFLDERLFYDTHYTVVGDLMFRYEDVKDVLSNNYIVADKLDSPNIYAVDEKSDEGLERIINAQYPKYKTSIQWHG